jgi:serine/threonine-protein phosphatase 2A regulatory subunit A
LEQLAQVEETVVRDMAVKSLIKIGELMDHNTLLNTFLLLVLRLANGDLFTSRVSAIHLITALYTKFGSQKESVRSKFRELCKENTPMVKRTVCKKIGELC